VIFQVVGESDQDEISLYGAQRVNVISHDENGLTIPGKGGVIGKEFFHFITDSLTQFATLGISDSYPSVAKFTLRIRGVQQTSGHDREWSALGSQDARRTHQMGQEWLAIGAETTTKQAHRQFIGAAYTQQLIRGISHLT
jgi:hypothetical protein